MYSKPLLERVKYPDNRFATAECSSKIFKHITSQPIKNAKPSPIVVICIRYNTLDRQNRSELHNKRASTSYRQSKCNIIAGQNVSLITTTPLEQKYRVPTNCSDPSFLAHPICSC
ncbi:hypothetical protein CW304_26115 [Bacillus sp. UFRGS-B20]|nr:hypothetical protein CW304_26115 [Bacillus sp. UFRGS-B20]